MIHNLKMCAHLFHMRYLVYKHAIGKAIKDVHVEMKDYAEAMTELVARTASDLD